MELSLCEQKNAGNKIFRNDGFDGLKEKSKY